MLSLTVRRWASLVPLALLVSCGAQSATDELTVTTDTSITNAADSEASPEAFLGFTPLGCPVYDLGALSDIDELDATMSPPWCTNAGIVTTYCGVSTDDIALRFSEDGEVISGESHTIDDSLIVLGYDTYLPGNPKAIFITDLVDLDQPRKLVCPGGEVLSITEEQDDLFIQVGDPNDLPLREELLPTTATLPAVTVDTSESTSTTVAAASGDALSYPIPGSLYITMCDMFEYALLMEMVPEIQAWNWESPLSDVETLGLIGEAVGGWCPEAMDFYNDELETQYPALAEDVWNWIAAGAG